MEQTSVQRFLPHRFPFLFVDRVTEFVPGEHIAAVKRFTTNDAAYRGYAPGAALVPMGIVLETVTQLGAVLVMERPEMAGKVAMILNIPIAQMHQPVRLGDTLWVEAKVIKIGSRFGELRGTITRDGELVAEGQMRFVIADADAVGLERSQQSAVNS